MENTNKIMEQMINTLNTSPACVSIMESLVNKAKENNINANEFEEFKQELFLNLFVKLVKEHKDIKELFIADIYNELRKA